MNIKDTIAAINQMQADSVIRRTAEHLAAIEPQNGRAKDKARLLQFIEAGALDTARIQDVIVRHGLTAAWRRFEQQFLGGTA
ncbi:MAG TPA: hypothetical protein VL361_26235 [Candidatus Limnocylindrales bacterium]|nr:hypothetical protein [Candidatus Limnocylindrales bacterium]